MRRIFVSLMLAILALLSGRAQAQQEYGIWYFGQGFGLDFHGGKPALLPGSAIWTSEGSAIICDRRTGSLLFYTDGVTVFDRLHAAMPHGRDLQGHPSSTQSALIVPMPGDSTKYYIFTTDQEGYDGPNRGACYSIVDMTLDGGRGDVTLRNVPLLAACSEKLTAVPHANGRDWWVLIHSLGGNTFHAFQVGEAGVSSAPVLSPVGAMQPGPSEQGSWNVGYLKASRSGRHLVGACGGPGLVELFDFDPCTGAVSNPIRLDVSPSDAPYGVAFSPDERKLYVAASRGLRQYDLTRYDPAAIIASRTLIHDAATGASAEVGGAMQLGPDGAIYTVVDGNWLGVITEPDAPGERCRYKARAIQVTSAFGSYWLGLPNNIDARRSGGGDIRVAIAPAGPLRLCQGESLTLDAGPGYGSYRWSTGETSRSIVVKAAGRYTVTVATAEGCGSATVTVGMPSPPRPRLDPEGTVYLCGGESVTLRAPPGYLSYRWSTGQEGGSITVGAPGRYSVTVVDSNGCTGISPATLVVLRPSPEIPVITRDGPSLLSTPAFAYQWMRDGARLAGENGRRLALPALPPPGTYRVAIVDSNGCGAISAPFTLPPLSGALPARREHRVWIDTASAAVGQHVRLHLRIAPPLCDADSALDFRAVLRIPPAELWVHGAAEGIAITGSARDGRFVIERSRSGAPLRGGELAWIEVEGLIAAAPRDPVTIDSIALGPGMPAMIAGPGLVMLSGCSVGRGEAFGEGLKITAVMPMPVREGGTLRYLAPSGIAPTLAFSDAVGRELFSRQLPPGTGDEQETRLDIGGLADGIYFMALRIPSGGSVLPIVVSR